VGGAPTYTQQGGGSGVQARGVGPAPTVSMPSRWGTAAAAKAWGFRWTVGECLGGSWWIRNWGDGVEVESWPRSRTCYAVPLKNFIQEVVSFQGGR
jgi:hypothetical protein